MAGKPLLALTTAGLLTWTSADALDQPRMSRDQVPEVSSAIRPFIDGLYSSDPKERAEAACQIGRRHTEAAAAIPVLLSMLSDDVPVAWIECEMSAWMRRELARSSDAARWAQTSPAAEAAEALSEIGRAAVPGLLEALRHEDWTSRMFAAKALGEFDRFADPAEVIGALASRLNDPHPEVRDRAAWALGEIEDPRATAPLLDALRTGDARLRTRAIRALGEIEDPTAVDGLVAALGNSDAKVREQAVWALGEIESDRAVPGLLPLLNDDDAAIRRKVAWALGEIESELAVDALVMALADPDTDVRLQVASALGEMEDPTALDGLVRALKDDDWRVRRAAAAALGEIEDPRALAPLRAAAQDERPEVRRAVAHALREIEDPRQR